MSKYTKAQMDAHDEAKEHTRREALAWTEKNLDAAAKPRAHPDEAADIPPLTPEKDKEYTKRWHAYQRTDRATNLEIDPTGPAHNFAPAIRSQADNLGDMMSLESGTVIDDEVLVREEFAAEADIHNILGKYGINEQMRPVKYGEGIDYTMDLQQAMMAVESAAEGYERSVPPELRSKYPTWKEWLNGVSNGLYKNDLQNLAKSKDEAEQRAKAKQEEKEKVAPEQAPQEPK